MANVISDETIDYVGILAKLELSEEGKEQELRFRRSVHFPVLARQHLFLL